MPYASPFHRLVVIGTLYAVEDFNFSLSIVPLGGGSMSAVTQALCDDVTAHVASWFGTSAGPVGPGISTRAAMVSAKLNRIDTDGRYMDAVAVETVLGTPIVGAVASNQPAQVSAAITLQTAIARGRGSKGRFYLPMPSQMSSLGTDGRITVAQALQMAEACAYLIREINSEYAGTAAVGVASNAGAGIHAAATEVRVGRVPDTIRSRRSSLAEDYEIEVI
jgi:hypothetical protein